MKQALLESLLPQIFQRTLGEGSPLSALTGLMSALHAPDEELLARLETIFSPRTAPERLVPFLARWVDLDRLFVAEGPAGLRASGAERRAGLPLGRLRELVAVAARCSQWRGTGEGLLLFLRAATGEQRFRLQENVDVAGRPRPFHLVVFAPETVAPSRVLIERVVQSEKPAAVTFELVFRDDNFFSLT